MAVGCSVCVCVFCQLLDAGLWLSAGAVSTLSVT